MISNDLSASLITIGAGFLTVCALMSLGLYLSHRTQKLTIVDTIWGLGFVAVTVVATLIGTGSVELRGLLLGLVGIWGIRLAWHLHRRNAGREEDPRYADLAQQDGRSFARVALMRVFIPQGLAMWLVAMPIMVGVNNAEVFWPLAILGALVWLIGFGFEAIGDWQLAQFKSDPSNKGKTMDQGLWRYTRHPNYFGDACLWFGIWLTVASSWPGLATVFSPAVMTLFLTKVTGASLNEKGMRKSKPDYEDYVRRTSGFFPLPPKS